MEIKGINREVLLEGLQKAVPAAAKNSVNPILNHVLIKVADGVMSIVGSDLEVEVRTTIAVRGLDESGGSVTVPARKLFDIIKSAPVGAKLNLRLDDNTLIITSGRSRFRLSTLNGADFPIVDVEGDQSVTFSIATDGLTRLLESTQRSMASQDVRYYLNGMLWELEGSTFHAVATDGHRLSHNKMTIDRADQEPRAAIVPRKAIGIFASLLSGAENECEITITPNHVVLSYGCTTIATKLIDGQFPDWRRVIPSPSKERMTVGLADLRSAASRAAILSNDKYRGVRLVLTPGELQLCANNPENEESEDILGVEYSGEGNEVGLNVMYMTDALSGMAGNEVIAHFGGPNSPVVLREADNDELVQVLMPMRL